MSQPTVSVIIVNFQTGTQVVNCLKSLKKSRPKTSFEIIVADNNHLPKLKSKLTKTFAKAKYLHLPTNPGFSVANNQAAKKASGKYLLFVNPDTQFLQKTLDQLIATITSRPHSAIAPLLVNPDGKIIPDQGSLTLTPARAIFSLSLIHRLWPHNPIATNYWLKNTSRKQLHQVDVIPGTAFLVKKSDFTAVDGFDESFFLYYEESDLCKRLTESRGVKFFIDPQAKLIHHGAQSTSKQPRSTINHHFQTSQLHYFTKHFGSLPGLLTHAALNLSSVHVIFTLILLLASFLRLYQLPTLMPFISDQGRDFLAAQQFLDTGQLPLLGIESSVPRFRQGPIFVWLTALGLFLVQGDPYAVGLIAATFGILSVGLLFLLSQKYFSTSTAIAASLLLATSPLAVAQSRLAFHTNPIPLFSLIYLYSLFRLPQNPHRLKWAALSFALLFQFELVVAPLILLIPATLYLSSTKPAFKQILSAAAFLCLGLLPQILYDLTHNFAQLGVFGVWIGYRLASFFGFDPEHAATTAKLSHTATSIAAYTQKFFSWFSPWPTAALVFGSILVGFTQFRRQITMWVKLLLLYLILSLVSFIIIGNASEAYMPALFAPVAILVARALNLLPRIYKYPAISAFIILAIFNSYFLFTTNFLTNSGIPHPLNPSNTYGPPISHQITAVQTLASFDTPVALYSTDPGAQFDSYLDNYRYLSSWLGLELSPEGVPVWINHTTTKPILGTQTEQIGTITINFPR